MKDESLKVLLVHPEVSRNKYNFAGVIENEPLELEYISTMLKEAGVSCEIWDCQLETKPLKKKIEVYRPQYVYLCGRTKQENYIKEYCKMAKDAGCMTIVGGIHVQHNYKRLYTENVDYILTTFDIYKILDILLGKELATIDGICYREDGEWKKNKECSFDINRLPRPDRSYFYEHMDRYRYLELAPAAHVRTAYCCPYQCRFCIRNQLNCGVYTVRDIADVVEEIKEIACDNIYFVDDDFLVDVRRIRELIRLIKEKDIHKKYICYGRADFIVRNPEIIKELKEIGFYYILTGLEAIEERQLKTYNKKSHPETNESAVKILNDAGIHMMGMFIVDLGFEAKDFRNLYRWIKKHDLKHVAVSIFTPEFSSAFFEDYKERLLTKNPENWDYLHVVAKPEKLSVRAYYFHYHILLVKLFLKGFRDGIYEFMDYGYYIRTIIKNLFRFGG